MTIRPNSNRDRFSDSDQKFVREFKDSEEYNKYKAILSPTTFKGALRLRSQISIITPNKQLSSDMQIALARLWIGAFSSYVWKAYSHYEWENEPKFRISKKAFRLYARHRSKNPSAWSGHETLHNVIRTFMEKNHPWLP